MSSDTTLVALLRGINVGGKNRVETARLRSVFESAGMNEVVTYINTGNVVFDHDAPAGDLVPVLEGSVESEFGFRVDLLVRPGASILGISDALPDGWRNDNSMKCDVLFLWDEIDRPEVLDELPVTPDIDDVVYVSGAVLWRIDRPDVTRSGLTRLAKTDLYRHVTVRNCNTVRKLAEIVASR